MGACIVLALVGGVAYLVLNPTRSAVAEMARVTFFVGLFWLGYILAGGHALRLP